MIKFELTILGTSSALPTVKRYHTAHVLNVRERFFLIDCGEGTQIQMKKYGIKFARINHIFISHLHGDHYFGLIGLLTTYALLDRKNDLHIYSHSELPDILKSQLNYLNDDLKFKIVWHPLNFKKSQTILENEAVKIISFPLKHRIPCCGFLFIEQASDLNIEKEKIEKFNIPVKEIYKIKKGEDYITAEGKLIPNSKITLPAFNQRSYAFCTDTAFIPELKKIIKEVDVLYHEATFDKTMEKRARETNHSTAEQAATLAKLANVGELLIGHFSARYKDIGFIVDEAKAVFENTQSAEEGMKISIPQKRIKR